MLSKASGIAVVTAVCLSTVVHTTANAEDKIKWKVQATFNTGWPALGDPIARVSKTLKEVNLTCVI